MKSKPANGMDFRMDPLGVNSAQEEVQESRRVKLISARWVSRWRIHHLSYLTQVMSKTLLHPTACLQMVVLGPLFWTIVNICYYF